ncbi:unnamed protein product [Coffea canephora]|uniref:DH200=94 genomic scaffold, scaffold_159 n=1 Tax=Coffea canephora TaxID=49390 RepID=A0A068VCM3_COFCA|nr:unnamed protein product [Coffea canephora]
MGIGNNRSFSESSIPTVSSIDADSRTRTVAGSCLALLTVFNLHSLSRKAASELQWLQSPSPGPGLAASERGRSNGSSVLIPFLLVHRIGDPIS